MSRAFFTLLGKTCHVFCRGCAAKHIARFRRQDVAVLYRINYTQSLREGQAIAEHTFLTEVKIATAIVLKILLVFRAKAWFTHLEPDGCVTLWKSDSSAFVFTTVPGTGMPVAKGGWKGGHHRIWRPPTVAFLSRASVLALTTG